MMDWLNFYRKESVMSLTMFAVSSRKALLSLVLLLALFIGLGGSPAEAQGFGSAYVFLWGSGNISEGSGHAKLEVNRMAMGAEYNNSASFRICFSGSASPGADFYVLKKGPATRMSISSNCFTDSWGTGNWFVGAKNVYHIRAISDNVSDPNETITATIDSLPSNYHLFGSYATAKFTIRGG